MPRILNIIGTRPEILKMAPVVNALQKNKSFEVGVLLTAQHRDLLDQMSQHFNLPIVKDLNLMTTNQTLSTLSSKMLEQLSSFYSEYKPDMVIAQGDTTTTFISSLACFYAQIPFGYVESGLRSGNFQRPFPEEMNRQFTSKIAALNFAPTELSKQNLLNDDIDPSTIFVTGNTIIDSLLDFAAENTPPLIKSTNKTILVTCHRRENFPHIRDIFDALKTIINNHHDVEIIYPVHPNPNVKIPAYEILKHDRIHLTDPLDYPQLVSVMKHAHLVLTDSGGLQEEAPALGKPVLVMRTETERPEGITAGAAKLVGVDKNNIIHAVNELLTNQKSYQQMTACGSPFGDGKASEKIAGYVADYFTR